MMKDLLQRLKALTVYEKAWFGTLLGGILLSTLFFAHFILTRPFLLQKRTLSCAETVGSLLHAREVRAVSPLRLQLAGVTMGGVPAAQLELVFETRFPGLIRLKSARFSGAELQIDPVTGELNGKTIPAFLRDFRSRIPVLLLRTEDRQLNAGGYLESGGRSRSFRFGFRKQKDGFLLEFRSGSCRVNGMLNGGNENWSAVFSGSGSLLSPLPGALPEGTVLSGEADWRWSLFRRGKGPVQSILSGRFGTDGGTILLQGAALRFAPGSEIQFNCSGNGFSGIVGKGTLFNPRTEVRELSFRSRAKGGLAFSGMVRLADAPGVKKGELIRPVPTKGYFVPQSGVLHAEAVIENASPDLFLPVGKFLPGKDPAAKLFWSLDEEKGRGSFHVECDFETLHFGQGGAAGKAKLTLDSRLHRNDSGYILPESRVGLAASFFRTPYCELKSLSLCHTVRGGNASTEFYAGNGRLTAGKCGMFTFRNGKAHFRENKGIFTGMFEAAELHQRAAGKRWTAGDPVFSFRYVPQKEELSLSGRAAGLQKTGTGGSLQAQECNLEVSYGKNGWEGTLRAGSMRRDTGGIPLQFRQARLRAAAELVLIRAVTVSGRWRETDFSGENFQLRGAGDFRCDKLRFKTAQAWEGKCAALEVQPGVLRCSGLSLGATAQKNGQGIALSGMELVMQGSSGTLRIARIAAPGNWSGSARLTAERTAEGLRFFGPALSADGKDTLMLSGEFRLAEQGGERLRAAFRRAPRKLPKALILTPSADCNAVLIVSGRTGISGEYRFTDRSFAGDVTCQLMDAALAMEQGYIRLDGVRAVLQTDFASGRMKSGMVPLRFASGTLGSVLHVGAGEAKLQIRGHGVALRDLQAMAMGGTLQSENPLECSGTPYHQMYFKAATIRPAELAGGGFALRCDGSFRVGNGDFGCSLKGGSGHIRLAPLAPFAVQEKSTLHDFVQAALVNFRAGVLKLDYLGRADGSGKMHIFATGSPEKPLPFVFDEVRQKFAPLEPGEPGFLGEIDLAVDYTFPAGGGAAQK